MAKAKRIRTETRTIALNRHLKSLVIAYGGQIYQAPATGTVWEEGQKVSVRPGLSKLQPPTRVIVGDPGEVWPLASHPVDSGRPKMGLPPVSAPMLAKIGEMHNRDLAEELLQRRMVLLRNTKSEIVDAYVTDVGQLRRELRDVAQKLKEALRQDKRAFPPAGYQPGSQEEYRRGYEEQARKNAKRFDAGGGWAVITNVFEVPPEAGGTTRLRIDVGGYRFRPKGETTYKPGDQVRTMLVHDNLHQTVSLRVGPARPQYATGTIEEWETLFTTPGSTRTPSEAAAEMARHYETEQLKARNAHLAAEVTRLRGASDERNGRHQNEVRQLRNDKQQLIGDLEAALRLIGAARRLRGDGEL